MFEIPGKVYFWRSNGRWHINLSGPDWVIKEICHEIRERGVRLENGPGGEISSDTEGCMLGTEAWPAKSV